MEPASVGYALTSGGLVAVGLQTPAGAAIDAVHRKRTLLALNLALLVVGAILLGAGQIDYARARGAVPKQYQANTPPEGLSSLLKDRVLLISWPASFYFT